MCMVLLIIKWFVILTGTQGKNAVLKLDALNSFKAEVQFTEKHGVRE